MKSVLNNHSYKPFFPKLWKNFTGLLLFIYISSSSINFCIGQGQDTEYLKKASSYIYTNKDSALFYIEKEINLLKDKNKPLDLLEAITYKTFVSGYYTDLTTFKTALDLETKIYNGLSDSLKNSENGFDLGSMVLYDQGQYYYKLNDYDRARNAFFKIVKRIENKHDSIIKKNNSFLTVSNSYLATMYTDELKYEIAEEFYNENLRLHELYEDSKTSILYTKNLLAELKLFQNKNSESIRLARESINYYEKLGPDTQLNSYISSSQILIDNYLELNKLDSAQYYINKTKPYLSQRKRFINSFNRLQADLLVKKEEYELAEKTYTNILKDLERSDNNLEQALIFRRLGKLHEQKGAPDLANDYYLKGINHVNNQEEITATHRVRLIELLAASNKILSNSANQEYLQLTLNQGQQLVNAVDSLKVSFINDGDKQNLIDASISGIEYSLKAVSKMHSAKPNLGNIEKAFDLIEKSKNNILLDALTKTKASNYSGIPLAELENEKRLRVTINNLQRDRSEVARSALFEAKQEYKKLIDQFETEYPKYYQLKYNTKNPTIQELKQQLPKNSLFLDFFVGSESTYLVTVSKQDSRFITIKNNAALKKKTIQFATLLSDHKSDLTVLKNLSSELYKTLIDPIVKSDTKHLIIAADGFLHYLPFEVLYNGSQYNIEQYSFSYANSASLLSQLKSKPHFQNKKLLAFAPNFPASNNNNTQLQSLPNNKKEVASILNFFDGKSLINEEASLKNFKTMLDKYGIVHLATHAIVDNADPEYSYLAFSVNENEENTMYVNDLYATNINANLVTLSACETGLGKLQKGEGMISLSRAFFYAGASSIAHTLWKVNDNASSKIMEGFYKELAEGKPKDQALRNAKLNFIDTNNDNNYSHPYYWAGFVISGDTSPVTSSSKKWAWFFVILLPALLVIYNRKNKKA